LLLLKVGWRSPRSYGSEDCKCKRNGLFEICRRYEVSGYYGICAVFSIGRRNFVIVGEKVSGVEIFILILRGLHGKRTVKFVI
jgi:hypothetical protein